MSDTGSKEAVFAFLLALACFLLFLFAIYLPADYVPTEKGDSAPDASRPASNPDALVVNTGYYVNNIYNIDIQTNTYILDFYLWFKWSCNNDKDTIVKFPDDPPAENGYEIFQKGIRKLVPNDEIKALYGDHIEKFHAEKIVSESPEELREHLNNIKNIRQDIIQKQNNDELRHEFLNTNSSADVTDIGADYDQKVKLYDDGECYKSYRVVGEFLTRFDLKKYPFDQQTLRVTIEDQLKDSNELIFVPDDYSGLAEDLNPNGWVIDQDRIGPEYKDHVYKSNWGIQEREQETQSIFSRFTIAIGIEREVLAYLLKTLLTLTVIVAVTGLTFFLAPEDLAGRTGFCLTTLLSLIALQFTVSSELPNIGYATATDNFFIIGYVLILLTTASVVWTAKYHEISADFSRKVNQRAGYYYTSIMFFALACNILFTKISDKPNSFFILAYVSVLLLLIAVIGLVTYSRISSDSADR